MRAKWSVGVVCSLLAVLLTGCQGPVSGADGEEDGRLGGTTASTAATATRDPGYGAVFLGVGECSSFGTTSFTEVACAGERASARVVARHVGRVGDGPPCPPTTDFVLHISAQRPSPDRGGRKIAQGYACMRGLQPPHPGDPGGGGGPRTIVGDCVRGLGDGKVRETACAGTGGQKPQYEVTKAVRSRADCPASTALYVQLGGADPVGCARPV
ncbi:hypothetical protein OG985_29185 [Streptomyces sp. NBC_00289]|uniref:hypothetical protein n=1 Tax=Streptomyces sp. NBC_00289 TaxID=2975703 RepID=UPI00324ED552